MGSRLRLQPEFFVRSRLARRRTTMGGGTKAIRQDYDRELRCGRERLYGCGDRSGLSRGRRIGESQLNTERWCVSTSPAVAAALSARYWLRPVSAQMARP